LLIDLKGLTAAQAAEMAAPDLADYKPIFFSAEEWQFILAALIAHGGGRVHVKRPLQVDLCAELRAVQLLVNEDRHIGSNWWSSGRRALTTKRSRS
jgi:hypothetical protein